MGKNPRVRAHAVRTRDALVKAAVAVVAAALAIGTTGCLHDADTTEDPAARRYTRAETIACLRSNGATVNALSASDRHLRALRDLAQGRTVEVRRGETTTALAFASDVAGAALLVELLAVPGNPYQVTRRGNVVALYRLPSATAESLTAPCFE